MCQGGENRLEEALHEKFRRDIFFFKAVRNNISDSLEERHEIPHLLTRVLQLLQHLLRVVLRLLEWYVKCCCGGAHFSECWASASWGFIEQE